MLKATIRRHGRCLLAGLLILGNGISLAQQSFQVTFGVRGTNEATDSGRHIIETRNGDLLVSGVGQSLYTDTGNRTRPILVRVDRDGRVLWQRIYAGLLNHEILALVADADREFALVASPVTVDPGSRSSSPLVDVAIHAITDQGELRRVGRGLESVRVDAVTTFRYGDGVGFVVAAAAGLPVDSQSPEPDISIFELRS